jgi:DNA-binding transcriptional LysR family regulator
VGGLRVKTRRVGMLRFAPYVAKSHAKRGATPPPWIGYDEAMAHLPQARWMQDAMKKDGGLPARLRVNDLEAALEAVAAGHGQTMLPCMIADADKRLRERPVEGLPQNTARELWLLVHADLAGLERARVVARWIEDLFSKSA